MRLATAIVLLGCLTQGMGVVPVGSEQGAAPVAVVHLTVELVSGQKATIRVAVGDVVTIRQASGSMAELRPSLQGNTLQLSVVAYETHDNERTDSMYPLPDIHLFLGTVVQIPDAAGLRVTWSGLSGAERVMGPCTRCCVVCQGDVFCGCVVETECGACCCPAACICPGLTEGRPCTGKQ